MTPRVGTVTFLDQVLLGPVLVTISKIRRNDKKYHLKNKCLEMRENDQKYQQMGKKQPKVSTNVRK